MTYQPANKSGTANTEMKQKKQKKKGFPFGIMIFLFLILAMISAAANTWFFINTGKQRIADIGTYTENYSITLADAFAEVAELSYKKRNYYKLRRLFQKEKKENTIDEAFFVLKNGKIIAHSDRETEKRLNWNLANDEFAYNMDLILKPAKNKSKKILFTDYNIIDRSVPDFTIPFLTRREARNLLKEYLYPEINKVGWMVGRAVFKGRYTVGTVNFIISKERIYNYITLHIKETEKYLIWSLAGSFVISLLISLAVFIQYRKIERKSPAGQIQPSAVRESAKEEDIEIDIGDDYSEKGYSEPDEKTGYPPSIEEEEFITIELLGETGSSGEKQKAAEQEIIRKEEEIKTPELFVDTAIDETEREILDAIPVEK